MRIANGEGRIRISVADNGVLGIALSIANYVLWILFYSDLARVFDAIAANAPPPPVNSLPAAPVCASSLSPPVIHNASAIQANQISQISKPEGLPEVEGKPLDSRVGATVESNSESTMQHESAIHDLGPGDYFGVLMAIIALAIVLLGIYALLG